MTVLSQPTGESIPEHSERPAAPNASRVSEWLESPQLPRLVRRFALQHGVRAQDLPDLLQEVYISLIRKGLESRVNATWVFRAIASKIVDYFRKARSERLSEGPSTDQYVSAASKVDPELVLLVESRASRLPVSLKNFYNLRYCLGLRQREVAERLGITRAAVRYLEQGCLAQLLGGASGPRRN